MIDYRNRVWPYEYMAFSRRIGELWEPFCKTCFDFPIRDDVELFDPPLFADVRTKLHQEIRKYIESLKLPSPDKQRLLNYYDKVWTLVTSGEIKLELDLHFQIDKQKYNVDFKSGFQSNEKGNTNRLLLVASIYKNIIESDNNCMLFVRAQEDDNNHYLQTLKNSEIWNVYCADETYHQINTYSGFDLATWIDSHINWEDDFDEETKKHIDEILKRGHFHHIKAYELNENREVELHQKYGKFENIQIEKLDFLLMLSMFEKKYDRVIANPPYGAYQSFEKREHLKERES